MRAIRTFATVLFTSLILSLPLAGCKEEPPPPPKIDLDQVHEAFLATSGVTFSEWVGNLEMKVNEIYTKDDFVSITVQRPSYGRLMLIGYVERNNTPGFQPRTTDELIFAIRQDNSYSAGFKYAIFGDDGHKHLERVYARPAGAPSPLYLAATVATFAFVAYYTAPTRYTVIRSYRTTYRRSPAYAARQARSASYAKATASKRAAARSSARSSRGGSSRGGK